MSAPRARILSVSGAAADHAVLRHAVKNTAWDLLTAATCREARQTMSYADPLVIFCECLLKDGTWKDVLEMVSGFDEPPFIVVISRLADDFLWSEVLNLGGYDVLAKPLVEIEVRRVLESLWTRHVHPMPRARVLPAAS
jgi:DNA-binding response OmpR family regulator